MMTTERRKEKVGLKRKLGRGVVARMQNCCWTVQRKKIQIIE
jgi:hypothetical protein